MSINSDQLAYLHDAIVRRLAFSVDEMGSHSLVLEVVCHPDSGYEPWNGRTLRLSAIGVCIFKANAYGYACGQESLDAIARGVSEAIMSEINKLIMHGMRPPNEYLTVILNSGSELAIACDVFSIEALP